MEPSRPTAPTLPDRIWVLGPTGAGKSTLTARLGAHLGVEATHMDDLYWQPDWVESPDDEMAARLAAVIARPRWVVDGNYTRFREPHTGQVQLFVWLDLPLRVTFTRLVRRGISRSLNKTACCNGNQETLRRTFLQRDSLLLWALTHYGETRDKAAAAVAGRPHVRLRSQKAADRWLRDVVGTGTAH